MTRTEEVWDAFASGLVAWFRARAPRDADPEELLQETFLRVHAGLGGLDGSAHVGAWVRGIARNVLVDAHRGARADVERVGEVPVDDDGSTATDEVAGWIEGFVAGLAPADREVLRLVDLEGLSQAEAAARLGTSRTAARSRVQRARRRLREALLACCAIELDARGGVAAWRRRGEDSCGPERC